MNPDLLIFLVALLFSAAFSASETSIVKLNPLNAGKTLLRQKLFERKDMLTTTCLVGNNLVLVMATLALARMLPADTDWSVKLGALGIQIGAFFLVGEALPKAAMRRIESAPEIMGRFLIAADVIFYPVTRLIHKVILYALSLFSQPSGFSASDVYHFIGSKGSLLKDMSFPMGMSRLGTTMARETMTPISDFRMLSADATVADVAEVMSGSWYSRYPVYEEQGVDLMGYVQVEDLLHQQPGTKIEKFLKSPFYVPESAKAEVVLKQMHQENLPMVFVISEYGAVVGLITLEDLAELFMGSDFRSSTQHQESAWIHQESENVYLLDGSLDFDDFNFHFGLSIPKQGFETLAGFIVARMQKIPKAGDSYTEGDLRKFTVLEADQKTVNRIRFEILTHPEVKKDPGGTHASKP